VRHDRIDEMTVVLPVAAQRPDASVIERAAACLRRGGLVAFPTETVYGLGVHALDAEAVRRLFDAKGRPAHDPLIVHVPSLEDARGLVADVPAAAERLAARFWPGSLTMVLSKRALVPDAVTAGLSSVAIRVPAHPVALALLQAARVPVAAPSANLFSRPSPTCAAHVVADLDGRIDMVLDAGPTFVGVESTVLDLTGGPPRVLRPGGVSIEALAEVLGMRPLEVTVAVSSDRPLPSPGLLERHYSPRAPLTVYEGDAASVLAAMRTAAAAARGAGQRIGLLLVDEDLVHGIEGETRSLGPLASPDILARNLYGALRDLDAVGVDVILAHGIIETGGLGAALRDRLRRAAAGRVIRVGSTDD
jgi:L-threonylcarbamoyladenylate synthase